MQIMGWNKTTLLDYPGRVATTVFTSGCNFRCPFCHNGDLVLGSFTSPAVSHDEFFSFLEKRRGVLTGVCISGGEPTLQPDLPSFLKTIKSMGYFVKLDTNGYQPEALAALYQSNLLDYVAMDIKTSPERYAVLTGVPGFDLQKINASISLIGKSKIPYEFRTTIVREFHDENVFLSIAHWLEGSHPYFLQSFQDQKEVIQEGLHSYSKESLEHFADLLMPFLPNTSLRGIS